MCGIRCVERDIASNSDYFTPLYKEIKDGGIAAMMWDLMHINIKGWHPRYHVPKTAALREQQELSLPPADQWWHQLLQSRGACPRASDAEADANPRRARARLLMDAAKKTVPGLRYSSDHMPGTHLWVRTDAGNVGVDNRPRPGSFRCWPRRARPGTNGGQGTNGTRMRIPSGGTMIGVSKTCPSPSVMKGVEQKWLRCNN